MTTSPQPAHLRSTGCSAPTTASTAGTAAHRRRGPASSSPPSPTITGTRPGPEDIAYINIGGTFYYLCSILDGCSRFIVHWEIRESMKESEVELIIERARERFPGVKPRIISDNGPQFIAKDFKSYVRLVGMTHVRISPYYPQSNGKIERWHRSLKGESIRVFSPRSLDEARQVVERYVDHYNNRRLHSAIGYVTPADRLNGREKAIWAERDSKLDAARQRRAQARKAARSTVQQAPIQAVA